MASVIKRMKNKAGSKKGGASFQFEFAIAVHSVDFVVADKKWYVGRGGHHIAKGGWVLVLVGSHRPIMPSL